VEAGPKLATGTYGARDDSLEILYVESVRSNHGTVHRNGLFWDMSRCVDPVRPEIKKHNNNIHLDDINEQVCWRRTRSHTTLRSCRGA
jgi:hypothetical protein